MGKAFGLVMFLVAIWTGVEIYTEGTHGAFGGLLADLGMVGEPAANEPQGGAPDRAAGRFQDAYDAQVDRVERQTGG